MKKNHSLLIISILAFNFQLYAQEIPAVYSNIKSDKSGKLYIEVDGKKYQEQVPDADQKYKLENLIGSPEGFAEGIVLNFKNTTLKGTLYYGFINYGDSRHPLPVYRRGTEIKGGQAIIPIKTNLSGRYDMIGWEKSGKGIVGYRFVNENGEIIYDGKIRFQYENEKFKILPTILEGPFVNLLNPEGATISFETNVAIKCKVRVDQKDFEDETASIHHEIKLTGLNANTFYQYSVMLEEDFWTYSFRTAPKPGSRNSFVFAYASDSRAGIGSGERDVYGANAYIIKKIMALNKYKNAAFMQFSGDLINGYSIDKGEMDLQYANWKHAVEPFAHYSPIYISMGNHEAYMKLFRNGEEGFAINSFPFENNSSESVFAEHFVNPKNGPKSEDGASYDPDKNKIDFPSYDENVFYYTYDNVGVIVLNSDYFYAPSTGGIPKVSGGLHGYIMDNQLEWLKKTVKMFEADDNIDHVFITQHTPVFPNGGHTGDDMWYKGNNDFRTYVAGKKMEKGILERRDEILDILINQNTKVIAILTGDEHNYCKTEISEKTPIYPENWKGEKLKISRKIWQINNGAAGAPYYAQEEVPWSKFTSSFSTQNAVVYFHVNGKKLSLEVLNPDTLEDFDTLILRKE